MEGGLLRSSTPSVVGHPGQSANSLTGGVGCGNSDSVPWGCHRGAGWLGCSVGTSEPFGRGLDTVALGGPPVFTSELIGEDSLAGH